MATNGNFAHQEQYKAAPEQFMSGSAPVDSAGAAGGNSNLSKDEVGWYFVEQYYTTLSKSPEKLHLFYGNRSQFVYGLEAEVANVSVGRTNIRERIKELDFQDCKVRVSNVDSQATFDNIVIQVIGETSNKSGEPKKFCQTFVLAKQPQGYFVLNDIFRFINEEGEDEPVEAVIDTAPEPEESAPEAAVEAEPATETAEDAPELNAAVVEKKLQDVSSTTVNGVAADTPAETADVPEAEPEATSAVDRDTAAQEIAEEDTKEPEKPKDPNPTPKTKAAAPAPEPAAAEPTGPPKPMTWASRAAAAAGPRPVVPLPKTATPPAAAQPRAPAPAAAAAAAAAPAQTSAPAPAAEAASKEASGWQTAGADSKRQNRPQSISAPIEKEGTMGYVKYVTDKVQDADLKGALEAHGEMTYFDINRQKNCAFVEYKTPEGYQAAVAANPHTVNGENIVVEPRRPKSTAYGGSNYGSTRGGASGRGRGGFEGNRTGGQGPRGNFSGQGRGRGGAGRGRGGAQAANA